MHPDERQWAKDNAAKFAQIYEDKTGTVLTADEAQQMLLATGYRMVDAAASKGPGGNLVAAQFISESAGGMFRATSVEYNQPLLYGNKDGSLTLEQRALPGHEAHPQLGMAVGAGVGLFTLGAVAPTVATAWALGSAYDSAGDVISQAMGLSKDGPSVGKSLAVGGVAGASSSFFLPLSTLGGGTTGKVVVGSYNSLLAGTGAFGATAITQSGNPDLSAGVGLGSYMFGMAMTGMFPGAIGNALNQINQILSGPAQNAITDIGDKGARR